MLIESLNLVRDKLESSPGWRASEDTAMAKVQVLNVAVLDNPSPFRNPFQFEITFECMEDLPEGRYCFQLCYSFWILPLCCDSGKLMNVLRADRVRRNSSIIMFFPVLSRYLPFSGISFRQVVKNWRWRVYARSPASCLLWLVQGGSTEFSSKELIGCWRFVSVTTCSKICREPPEKRASLPFSDMSVSCMQCKYQVPSVWCI